MTSLQLLRAIVIAGYLSLAVLASIAVLSMRDLLRRLIAAGLLLMACSWLAFYIVTAELLGGAETSMAELEAAVVYSRLAHFPAIGMGIAVVVMLLDRETRRAAERRKASTQLEELVKCREMTSHG